MADADISVTVARSAVEDLSASAPQAADKIAKTLMSDVADGEEGAVNRILGDDATQAGNMNETAAKLQGSADPSAAGIGKTAATPSGPAAPGEEPVVPEAGIESTGASSAETGGTDPIDVVSGQLLASAVDVALDGILPLVLRRAYASGYAYGGLFGPGWSSTLDQRLIVDPPGAGGGVRLLGDDAQALAYGAPPGLGLPAYPAHGARWPLTLDRGRGQYRVEDPQTGLTWSFTACADGGGVSPLESVADRNGNRLRLVRDEGGTLIEVASSGGYRIGVETETATARGGSRVTALRLLNGSGGDSGTLIAVFDYDDVGRLTRVIDSSGVPLTYLWDAADRICGWIDHSGYTYSYEYDEAGRVVGAVGDGGLLSSALAYDPETRTTTVTDSLGHTVVYHFDRFQHVTKTVDALEGETTRQADRFGRLCAYTDQLGNTMRIERDDRGNAIRVEHPDGSVVTTRYNAMNLPVEAVGPDGGTWRYTYDDRGNRTTRIDPSGAVYGFEYGERGAPRAAVDPLGAVTRFETDSAGLPLAVIDPLGAATRVERDPFGRIGRHVDASGGVTRTGWSVEGLLSWRVDADGSRQEWAYDPSGNLIEHRDALGNVSTTEYGPFGRPAARISSSGTRYEFSYDTELRLTEVTNPDGALWRYEYDALGRVCAEHDFNGRTLRYRHDAVGHLVERVNGLGETTTFAYDEMGRLIERRAGEAVYRHSYDAAGRMLTAEGADISVSCTRDPLGRVLSETVNGRTIIYRYDAAGRRTHCRTPSGAASRWSYDLRGMPVGLATAAGTLAFERDAMGRETFRQLGYASSLSQSFDVLGRLTGQEIWARPLATPGTGPGSEAGSGTGSGSGSGDRTDTDRLLQQRSFVYREDGMPTTIGDALRGQRDYTLDRHGRVTAVQAHTWSEAYAYDAVGNLAQISAPGDPDVRGEAEHSGTLTRRVGRTTYQHDAQGRVTRTVRRTLSGQSRQWIYAWDGDDRLTGVTTPDGTVWQYTYDPLGRRHAKTGATKDGTATAATYFTWDGARLVEQAEIRPDGAETVLTWDYEPGTYRPAAQTRRNRAADASQLDIDAEFYAIVADAMGTPQELVAPDGHIAWHATTSLWGERILAADPETDCPLGFPGQYLDHETGLHYNYQRYYDPATASYLAPDPLGLAPSTNHHRYVANPLAWCDPLGLDPASATPAALTAAPARPELTQGPVAKARAWQGSGNYPGIDDYRNVNLNEGDVVYGGYPWPTEYFTTSDGVALADGDATKLYEGVQVAPHAGSYRPQVRAYTVTQKTTAAYGLTDANPQHGSGGLPQLFIPNWRQVLKPGEITDMQNWEHAG